MKYKVLLFDIDDTLLDFDKAETLSIIECFEKYNISYNDDVVKHYKEINLSYWKEFEKGNTTIPKLMVDRFKKLLSIYKEELVGIASEFNEYYLSRLNLKNDIIPNADIVIKELKKYYKIYPASNGVGATQVDRIESSKLKGLFDKYYVSGFIGYQKPSIEFFDYIFNDLKEYKKEDFLMIGDSETSDINGGINAGIDTCYFNNRAKKLKSAKPKYEINNLLDLLKILK